MKELIALTKEVTALSAETATRQTQQGRQLLELRALLLALSAQCQDKDKLLGDFDRLMEDAPGIRENYVRPPLEIIVQRGKS